MFTCGIGTRWFAVEYFIILYGLSYQTIFSPIISLELSDNTSYAPIQRLQET